MVPSNSKSFKHSHLLEANYAWVSADLYVYIEMMQNNAKKGPLADKSLIIIWVPDDDNKQRNQKPYFYINVKYKSNFNIYT